MAAKEKLEKLKKFLRGGKANTVNLKKSDFTITPDIEKEIGPQTPLLQRIKAIRELCEVVLNSRIEDYGIEKLWAQVKDLLVPEVEKEYRHAVIYFIKCLVKGQYENLGMMRVAFFNAIKRHDIAEDIAVMFDLLEVLTLQGRDIQALEDDFASFLASWLPAVAGAGKVAPFLNLLVNFIKCNAAYVDDVDILTIVQSSCFICCWSQDATAVENSLKVLATIVCYSELPGEGIKDFVSALCRKVNTQELTHTCWKVMRDLLGTHMGHSTLFTLCKFLQDRGSYNDRFLLRGAVFFIHTGLWSDKRVQSLKCTPTSVLPSLLQAVECGHSLVIYEIILCVQRLVTTYGLDLHHPAWDVLLEILSKVCQYVDGIDPLKIESALVDDSLYRVASKLHDTLTLIEQLIELGQFNGSMSRVFEIIDMSSKTRPESSVLRLIAHQAQGIKPTRSEWLTKLENLMERYYKNETRPNIRIKAVEVASSVLSRHRFVYEEELLERIILTYLGGVEMETDLCVRNSAAQLLIALCTESESKKCLDVFDILEKLMNRPFDQNLANLSSEGDILDIKTVASGLIQIFRSKMHHTPACHAVRAFKILLSHLELHYQHPHLLNFHHGVHVMIFEMLLKLRIHKLGLIGLSDSSGTKFSPYLVVESSTSCVCSTPPLVPFSLLSASKVIVSALRSEKDWRIVSLLLQELPILLQNKALVADGADVGHLADALCSIVSDKSLNLPESLQYAPPKLSRTEFQSLVYPVIAALSAYHTHLEPSLQAKCIKCLECGLASRSAGQCVLAITTCTLEMRDAMYKLLPEVLLNLSKISATVVIAIPILEFLSTLTSLPKIFASFVGDQYMSVFAIALPYTNPFKYNHYTVSLAHHVIAVWFLKCRLPFRRDFVKFIITGLQSNAIAPFEESHAMKPELAYLNEDSTSRKRSSSLTEQGSRRRERPLPNTRLGPDLRPPLDEALWNFHTELKETCIDLMARYTFSSCDARPTRSAIVDALLRGGQSQTWLLGHKLITVTTSRCSQKPLKNNLCDRCVVLCRFNTDNDSIEEKKPVEKTKEDSTNSDELDPEMERLISDGDNGGKAGRDVCSCWCQGWAEIHVRRPTGEMSWVIRLENGTPSLPSSLDDQPMADLAALFLTPGKRMTLNANDSTEEATSCDSPGILSISNTTEPSPRPGLITSPSPNVSNPVSIPGSPTSRQSSRESLPFEEDGDDGSDPGSDTSGKSRNPVRRSNSSPEMSANWKNPFLKDKGPIIDDSSKARVSCEAIPEEMTPPDPPPPVPPRADVSDRRLDVGLSVDVTVKSVRGPATTGEIESSLDEHTALPTATFTRDRSRTISVMSPVRKSRYDHEFGKPKPHSPRNKEAPRSGVSPSFVFLQLYHSAYFGHAEDKPILITSNPVIQRAVSTLDLITPFETHKVGVIYVGPGQSAGNEAEVLANEFGSLRYAFFLQRIGTLINLKDADPQATFLGGLDKSGVDGKFAYIWQDDVTQVTFHVATLMPNKESDPNCNAKKSHIGNDYVTIVYNESGEDVSFIKLGQFTYVNVVVEPMDLGSHKVTVKTGEELADFGHREEKIVSDDNLPILARQLALHANLASEVSQSLNNKNRDPYASNWLERLRKIKRLRKKLMNINEMNETESETHHHRLKRPVDPVDDFTEYT